MSAVQADRLAATRKAIEARRPLGRLGRRVVIGYLIALVAAPPVTVAVQALTRDNTPETGVLVSRVVESRCLNGRIQQGIDTGRADGALLAHDTGETC
ncbi:hypothetical protein GCM10022223_38950 [Kineosporia mesophila]|uniref:Uncharacterized protein n=1 Tax=Kineosporia mesophila TaxID=566012 RepID=A0ABP6ZV21_9ACTN|nr:hypothetical protein [Kineosporia mesophila]MCD5348520.1 hypothetical protein [Kineosporia mesophila]